MLIDDYDKLLEIAKERDQEDQLLNECDYETKKKSMQGIFANIKAGRNVANCVEVMKTKYTSVAQELDIELNAKY